MRLLRERRWRLVAALAAGLLQHAATGLEPLWWAAWLAPIPLLIAAFESSHSEAWMLSLFAGVIGSASWLSYEAMFMGSAGAWMLVLGRAAILGLAVTRTQAMVERSTSWAVVFVFPTLMAAIDMFIAFVSPHGTAGSIAYSQMLALPVIQIASIAGTPGIVFVVNLFASLVAVGWYLRSDITRPLLAYGLPIFFVAAVVVFGLLRLGASRSGERLPVALLAIDRDPHIADSTVPDLVWAAYITQIPNLARSGAKMVVIPEKVDLIDIAGTRRLRESLSVAAQANAVYLLAGVEVDAKDHHENRAWLFDPTGQLLADYEKHHLVPGFEDHFTHGETLAVRSVKHSRVGIAICKDMDFPLLGRSYSRSGVHAMIVPAWDFKRDAWLHAQMAMLRGVEGGYTIIRSARDGLLTVSDRYGRVVGAVPSASSTIASIAIVAPLGPGEPTVYGRVGDLFGWICVAAAAVILLAPLGRRKSIPL